MISKSGEKKNSIASRRPNTEKYGGNSSPNQNNKNKNQSPKQNNKTQNNAK